MRMSVCIFIILLCFTTNVTAASFDCAKASINIEKMICADEKLSRLDEELNKVYKQAFSTEASKEELKKQQLTWIKKLRNPCKDSECLKARYNERIAALNSSGFKKSQLIGNWCSAPCYYATPTRPYDLPCDFKITATAIEWRLHKQEFKRPYEIIDQTKNKEILMLNGGNEHSWYSSKSLPTIKHKLIFDAGMSEIIGGVEDLELSDFSYNISSKTWDLDGTVYIKRGKCGL